MGARLGPPRAPGSPRASSTWRWWLNRRSGGEVNGRRRSRETGRRGIPRVRRVAAMKSRILAFCVRRRAWSQGASFPLVVAKDNKNARSLVKPGPGSGEARGPVAHVTDESRLIDSQFPGSGQNELRCPAEESQGWLVRGLRATSQGDFETVRSAGPQGEACCAALRWLAFVPVAPGPCAGTYTRLVWGARPLTPASPPTRKGDPHWCGPGYVPWLRVAGKTSFPGTTSPVPGRHSTDLGRVVVSGRLRSSSMGFPRKDPRRGRSEELEIGPGKSFIRARTWEAKCAALTPRSRAWRGSFAGCRRPLGRCRPGSVKARPRIGAARSIVDHGTLSPGLSVGS